MQPTSPVSSDEPPMTADTQPFRFSGVSEITATSLLKWTCYVFVFLNLCHTLAMAKVSNNEAKCPLFRLFSTLYFESNL